MYLHSRSRHHRRPPPTTTAKAYHLALALLSYLPSPPPPSFHLPDSLQLSHVKTAPGTSTTTTTGGGGWPRHRTGSQDWRVALPEVKLATVVVVLCRLMWDLDLALQGGGGGPAATEEEEEEGVQDS